MVIDDISDDFFFFYFSVSVNETACTVMVEGKLVYEFVDM